MPKTKFQELIFSVMMAAAMVYAMELYNLALEAGSLSGELFLNVFHDLVPMGAIVIILQKFIAGPVARKLAFRYVTPGSDNPVFMTLFTSAFTVCLMCPMMSGVATALFKHAGTRFFPVWLETTARNFPTALCWQIFFAGPLVRFLFRRLFAKQLSEKTER
jgi:hypothetical protein